MDGIVYRFVEARLHNYEDIRFHMSHDNFYQLVDVMEHRFLLMHGDAIPMHMTLP